MLRSFVKTFLRRFRRNLTFSLLNIIGLSIGIGISFAILLYVQDELRYDKFHSDAERMYRVGISGVLSGEPFEGIFTCAPLSRALREEVPGVENAVRITQWDNIPVEVGSDKYLENDVVLADSTFFQFFDFRLLAGNPTTVLSAPNQVVLSEDWVIKYFGRIDYDEVIGKSILLGNERKSFQITGVAENTPKASHFRYSIIYSIISWNNSHNKRWVNNNLLTYFKLMPGTPLTEIESQLDDLVVKYVGPEIQELLGISVDEWESFDGDYGYFAQPLLDIHLHSHYNEELSVNGSYQNVVIFSSVALFVLLIAGVNFVNLSTARATDRARETGIKKAVGAHRSQLIGQFLSEAIFYVLLATVVAILVILLLLPQLNEIMGKQFTIEEVLSPLYLASYLGVSLLIGLLAGIYPALVLSSFKTVEILKGKSLKHRATVLNPRNLLVGFQFVLTTIAVLTTLVVHNQLNLMRTLDLGFDKELVLVINNAWSLDDNQEAFKNDLSALPAVKSVNLTSHYPPEVSWSSVYRVVDLNEDHLFFHYWTDETHLETLGLELLEGRFFEEGMKNEHTIVINQAAKKRLGWKSIDGKFIRAYDDERTAHAVIGVVQDFHFQDLYNEVRPTALLFSPSGRYVATKLEGHNLSSTLQQMEEIWARHASGRVFDYVFLDDQVQELWVKEEKLANLTMLFSIMTIFTAGLGLYGLAAYVARGRRREFGIRKILGARQETIIMLQGKYFFSIALISLAISVPVAVYLINDWLNSFAYRIDHHWTLYLLAIALVVVIILLSVGQQLWKSSRIIPAEVVKEE